MRKLIQYFFYDSLLGEEKEDDDFEIASVLIIQGEEKETSHGSQRGLVCIRRDRANGHTKIERDCFVDLKVHQETFLGNCFECRRSTFCALQLLLKITMIASSW